MLSGGKGRIWFVTSRGALTVGGRARSGGAFVLSNAVAGFLRKELAKGSGTRHFPAKHWEAQSGKDATRAPNPPPRRRAPLTPGGRFCSGPLAAPDAMILPVMGGSRRLGVEPPAPSARVRALRLTQLTSSRLSSGPIAGLVSRTRPRTARRRHLPRSRRRNPREASNHGAARSLEWSHRSARGHGQAFTSFLLVMWSRAESHSRDVANGSPSPAPHRPDRSARAHRTRMS